MLSFGLVLGAECPTSGPLGISPRCVVTHRWDTRLGLFLLLQRDGAATFAAGIRCVYSEQQGKLIHLVQRHVFQKLREKFASNTMEERSATRLLRNNHATSRPVQQTIILVAISNLRRPHKVESSCAWVTSGSRHTQHKNIFIECVVGQTSILLAVCILMQQKSYLCVQVSQSYHSHKQVNTRNFAAA
uniref:Uncharacterized protein n=1 Tax=Rhipicephalus zambeziensis TaxID=60191 RepID=A0A224YH21_9ACAR